MADAHQSYQYSETLDEAGSLMASKRPSRDGNLSQETGQAPQLFSDRDWMWALALTVASGLLYLVALGDVPLRDWDEGTRASVAREIFETGNWLHPTQFGQPYMLKPPLMDWLVALCFKVGGVNEWAARLPGALASALGVPAIYFLGRSLFVNRAPALLSAATFLTLLPVARHGRLLMLDGMSVTAFLAMLLCIARCVPVDARNHGGERNSPRDRGFYSRWAIGIGLGLGWIGLTKGLLAIPLGGIAFAWMLWQYRLVPFKNAWFYVGVILGLGAGAMWYGAQFYQYGGVFWRTHFLTQGFDRLAEAVERHQHPPWYYGLELLKYAWPWLVFWPLGLRLAWQERHRSWGSLVLIGTVGYFGIISVMGTKLPWYVMPLYPFVAMAVGAYLGEIWQGRRQLLRNWGILFAAMGALTLAGGLFLWVNGSKGQWMLLLMGGVLSGTFAIAARLMWQQRRTFIPFLLSGTYIGLLLLVLSGEWVWELNEAFDVRPVAEMVRSRVPPNSTLYSSFRYERPALNFYCHCKILPADRERLEAAWSRHYLLLERAVWPQFQRAGAVAVGSSEEFVLVAPQLAESG